MGIANYIENLNDTQFIVENWPWIAFYMFLALPIVAILVGVIEFISRRTAGAPVSDPAQAGIIRTFRRRASHARVFGWVLLAVIVELLLSGVLVYQGSDEVVRAEQLNQAHKVRDGYSDALDNALVNLRARRDINANHLRDVRDAVADTVSSIDRANAFKAVPRARSLNDVEMIDSMNGWAVGDKGLLLKTINGGSNWTVQAVPTDADLHRITFDNKYDGVALALDAGFLRTSDGGNSWKLDRSQTNLTYRGTTVFAKGNLQSFQVNNDKLWFGTTEQGWGFVSMSALRSRLENQIIKKISDFRNNSDFLQKKLNAFSLISEYEVRPIAITKDNIFLVYRNILAKMSINEDENEFELLGIFQKIIEAASNYRSKLWLLDIDNEIHVSTDGGKNWRNFGKPRNISRITASIFLGKEAIIVGGDEGKIGYLDIDSGSWRSIAPNLAGIVKNLSSDKKNIVWATTNQGAILKVHLESMKWIVQIMGNLEKLEGIVEVRDNIFAVSTTKGLVGLMTPDGVLRRVSRVDAKDQIEQILTLHNGNIAAVTASRVWQSHDYGATWSIAFETPGPRLSALRESEDRESIWLVGEEGLVVRSLTEGDTWTVLRRKGANLVDGLFKGSSNGLLLSKAGAVFSIEKANENMQNPKQALIHKLNMGADESATTIRRAPNGDVFVLSSKGGVYRRQKGQSIWERGPRVVNDGLNDIAFRGEQEAWIVGDAGVILRTGDGGNTWIRQAEVGKNHLRRIIFDSSGRGWITGSGGTFLRRQAVATPRNLARNERPDKAYFNEVYSRISAADVLLEGARTSLRTKIEAQENAYQDSLDALHEAGRKRIEAESSRKSASDAVEKIRKSTEHAGTLSMIAEDENGAFDAERSQFNYDARVLFETQVWLQRAGTILIMLFLVQVFIGLYRYATRLAAYYDARADALVLAMMPATFATVADALTPSPVEFANQPKYPIDAISKMVDKFKK